MTFLELFLCVVILTISWSLEEYFSWNSFQLLWNRNKILEWFYSRNLSFNIYKFYGSVKVTGQDILFIYLFIYLWLCWVFVSVRGLSPVAASGGHSPSRRAGLSPSRPLPLRSTGSRRAGSAAVAHGPSRSAARGILPDQGSNPCPLHWQADSQPLRHQGSPGQDILKFLI